MNFGQLLEILENHSGRIACREGEEYAKSIEGVDWREGIHEIPLCDWVIWVLKRSSGAEELSDYFCFTGGETYETHPRRLRHMLRCAAVLACERMMEEIGVKDYR